MNEPSATAQLQKVTLAEKFAKIQDHWNPRIVGELNGQQVKLVKIRGAFDWHPATFSSCRAAWSIGR